MIPNYLVHQFIDECDYTREGLASHGATNAMKAFLAKHLGLTSDSATMWRLRRFRLQVLEVIEND
tara:strand:+ start:4269 stop:4463 length:195 start_codon:yes stop_codon:yes gene_type:complete